MSDRKWTPEQQQAIEARNCSLLVAAAAGSGKTSVLVERIIERVLDPNENIDIDRLMVVTFTDAAASEMRERIGVAISQRMNALSFQTDTAFRKRLKRQLTLLNKATISTMHAFCSKLIRKNFNKIDLDPNFRVLDAIEADLLKEEAMELVLQQQYEGTKELQGLPLELFETLLDIYGGKKGDDSLKGLLLRIYKETSSNPFPKQWREESLRMFFPENLVQYQDDFSKSLWGSLLVQQLKQEVPDWIFRCKQAIQLCEEGENPAYIPVFQYRMQYFQSVLDALEQGWDCIKQAIYLYAPGRTPNKTPGCDENSLTRVKETLEEIKDAVELYQNNYFSKTSAENVAELTDCYEILQGLCVLVDDFTETYGEMKQQKCALDYDDLEHFALRILTEYPEVATELQNFYEEVYTDEYQDTNMTQETILRLVSRHAPQTPNLFMVGDIKQSIYGFRQARPDIFLKKYNTFSPELESEERIIRLYKNFRSRQDVIASVNYLFTKMMVKDVCGMAYTTEEYLNLGANYEVPMYDVACELLVTDSKTEIQNDEIEEKNKTELEAVMIGKRIQQLLEEAKGALQYKDIVILLRATKNKADVFAETLAKQGIPTFCDVNAGFYQSREGKVVLALLQIIDNPLQDIPLLAVLKSPIGGFSEDEIVRMRLINREKYLYYNLKALAEAGDEKAGSFLEQLQYFRTYAAEHLLSELISELYRKTDYYNYAGVFSDGAARQANLQKMQEEAVKYERQTGGGIFEFLAYVEKIKSSEGDLGGATLLGENDNVVRIMSIHKSKGLEFPVVFLANMDKGFNRRDFSGTVLMHQELGFGMSQFDRQYRIKYETTSKMAMKQKKNQELIAEEMRLLYVAMTRAKEKLILSGTIPKMQQKLQKYWSVLEHKDDMLPVRYVTKANSYFDFIVPLLLRHPDLKEARELAEIPNNPLTWRTPELEEETCHFYFSYVPKDMLDIENTMLADAPAKKEIIEMDDQVLKNEIEKRLATSYAFSQSAEIPAKISVSQLNQTQAVPQLLRQPQFMEGKRNKTAAEWGTIAHYILQHISLHDVSKESIQVLCRRQGLSEEEIQQFDWENILTFFAGPIGRRMCQAKNVYREKAFTMEVPAKQLFPNISNENQDAVLVQGVIDCYFEEADGIVILDYKTDRVLLGEEVIAAEKYRKQLELYKRAIETETKERVKETIIYFLQTGEYVVQ